VLSGERDEGDELEDEYEEYFAMQMQKDMELIEDDDKGQVDYA